MEHDDPFAEFDGNHTVILPTPGGKVQKSPQRNRDVQTRAPVNASLNDTGFAYDRWSDAKPQALSNYNPMVSAASTLLILAHELSNSINQGNVTELRERVIKQIRQFEESARRAGYSQSEVLAARFLLCAYLDEGVLSTPWGSNSDWSSQTLVSLFHQQRGSGEKFFQVVEKLLQNDRDNLHLIELAFLCLAFGFKGKYRVVERGSNHLLDIQEHLYRVITNIRGTGERNLSPRWMGVVNKRSTLTRYVPTWVFAAVAGVLLMSLYAGFGYVLHKTSQPAVDKAAIIKQQISSQ